MHAQARGRNLPNFVWQISVISEISEISRARTAHARENGYRELKPLGFRRFGRPEFLVLLWYDHCVVVVRPVSVLSARFRVIACRLYL